MSNYIEEFGYDEHEQSCGKDNDYHDDDDCYDEIEYDEEEGEDYDPRSGDMMDDLGLSWRDFY